MLLSRDASFVTDVVLSNLPIKRRRSSTGFLNVNCPMCHLVGNHRPDTKMRCGIMVAPTAMTITCFNCGFKTGFTLGQTLSRKFREFMEAIGIHDTDIKRLNHAAFTIRHIMESSGVEVEAKTLFTPQFESVRLPEGAKSFEALARAGCTDPDFLDVVEYTYGRGEDIANSTTFYWTPVEGKHQLNRRVIIPFYHEEKIVGYTGRIVDDVKGPSRYHTKSPLNYIFNNHVLKNRNRAFILAMEGPTDALAIDGVSLLGAKCNDQQAQWLKSTGKQIIIVPDRDESGARLIDAAIANSWSVSFPWPWWDDDVKDVALAVRRYGRLYTLTSILKSATQSNIEITVKRKLLL